jgi:hypothetical protein
MKIFFRPVEKPCAPPKKKSKIPLSEAKFKSIEFRPAMIHQLAPAEAQVSPPPILDLSPLQLHQPLGPALGTDPGEEPNRFCFGAADIELWLETVEI